MTMKAIILSSFGGPEVLDYRDVAVPEPEAHQIRVRVRTIGVNFADALIRRNEYAMTPPLPSIPGSEVAGEVDQIGSGVEGFAIGERVAVAMFAAGEFFGGYSEYVVIDARYAVPIPDGLSFGSATALMVQGLTALYLTRVAPAEGRSILVSAAAGGVGSLLVQIARLAGARLIVAAASTTEKLDFACGLGADFAVNYREPEWGSALLKATGDVGPDIVYESAGADILPTSLDILAPRGEIVVYGALNIRGFELGPREIEAMIFKNQALRGFALVPLLDPGKLRTDLTLLFEQAMTGKIAVQIGAEFPLSEAAAAHAALESRGSVGKLILNC